MSKYSKIAVSAAFLPLGVNAMNFDHNWIEALSNIINDVSNGTNRGQTANVTENQPQKQLQQPKTPTTRMRGSQQQGQKPLTEQQEIKRIQDQLVERYGQKEKNLRKVEQKLDWWKKQPLICEIIKITKDCSIAGQLENETVENLREKLRLEKERKQKKQRQVKEREQKQNKAKLAAVVGIVAPVVGGVIGGVIHGNSNARSTLEAWKGQSYSSDLYKVSSDEEYGFHEIYLGSGGKKELKYLTIDKISVDLEMMLEDVSPYLENMMNGERSQLDFDQPLEKGGEKFLIGFRIKRCPVPDTDKVEYVLSGTSDSIATFEHKLEVIESDDGPKFQLVVDYNESRKYDPITNGEVTVWDHKRIISNDDIEALKMERDNVESEGWGEGFEEGFVIYFLYGCVVVGIIFCVILCLCKLEPKDKGENESI